jgi:uncharacterized membrane protein
MQLWHPAITYFAVAFLLAAVISEALNLFTRKRFWALVAKYHLLCAAVLALFAVVTGFIDYRHIWKIQTGYQFLQAHIIIGFISFFIIQLMANYRFIMQKMLPSKIKIVYLAAMSLGLGLVLGASHLGKTAVYHHGTGVRTSMFKFEQTELYLKNLYGLEKLDPPTVDDSLRALIYLPLNDSIPEPADTLAQAEPERSH